MNTGPSVPVVFRTPEFKMHKMDWILVKQDIIVGAQLLRSGFYGHTIATSYNRYEQEWR